MAECGPAAKSMAERREADLGGPSLHPIRDWVSRGFGRVDDVVYVGLGLLLAISALALLTSGALDLWQSLLEGSLARNTVSFLDRVLLILMIVEILSTVQVSFREPALVAEPFLIVALIAAIRRNLVLTAEFSRLLDMGEVAFRNAMIELGLLTVMVVALVGSLFLLHKQRPQAAAVRS